MKVVKRFRTRAAAEAFAEGVRYVNDSSVEVTDIRRVRVDDADLFEVILEDADLKESA